MTFNFAWHENSIKQEVTAFQNVAMREKVLFIDNIVVIDGFESLLVLKHVPQM